MKPAAVQINRPIKSVRRQAFALGEVVSNTSAAERQYQREVLISEAMGTDFVPYLMIQVINQMNTH